MTRRAALISFRLFFGLLTLSAIGTQFVIHVQQGFSIVNFFSYFTNLSNLFAAAVFLFGVFQRIKCRHPSLVGESVRGAAAMSMTVVGVVFTALLRDVDLGHLLPWINTLLHYVMPVAVLMEWIFQPPITRLGVRQILSWQIFPLLYLFYILIRGAFVGWYPYPFLHPSKVGGYGGVALYALGIMTTFLITGWALGALANKRSGDDAPVAA